MKQKSDDPSSYQRLRKALDVEREKRSVSDEELVLTLTESFTPGELAALHKQAVLANRSSIESAVVKAMTNSHGGKPMSEAMKNSILAPSDAVKKSRTNLRPGTRSVADNMKGLT